MQLTVVPMQAEHIGFVHSILTSPHNKAILNHGDISLKDWGKSFSKNLADPDEKNYIIITDEPVTWIKLNGLQGKQAWLLAYNSTSVNCL